MPERDDAVHNLRASAYDVVALQELWDDPRKTLGETGLAWAGDELQDKPGTRMRNSGLGVKVRWRSRSRSSSITTRR